MFNQTSISTDIVFVTNPSAVIQSKFPALITTFALSLMLCLPHSLTFSGSDMVEAQCQRFEVRSADGETVLFSADEEEISIGTEKLRVTGRVCAKTA